MEQGLEKLTSRFASWDNLVNTIAVLEKDEASIKYGSGCEGCTGCGQPLYPMPLSSKKLDNSQYECEGCGACSGCAACSCEG